MSATVQKIEDTRSELVIIDSSPATLSVNYDQVKRHLESELKKYDVVVTIDTVADAKKLTTELNRRAGEIDKVRKVAVEKVSTPIRAFESQMKELVLMCKNGRTNLLNQIAVFEKKTLDDARKKMEELLNSELDRANVSIEFRKSSISTNMVKLTAVTAKGNLTAKTVSDIRALVAADKQLQDQTEKRLLVLENQSYRAGLSAPLTRAHVESFLFSDDDEYQARLDLMLESEKSRQEATERAFRERIATEQQPIIEPIVVEAEQSKPVEPQEPENIKDNIEQVNKVLSVASEYGYGPVNDMESIRFTTTTRDKIESLAISEFPEGNLGIWVREGLIVEITRHPTPINK